MPGSLARQLLGHTESLWLGGMMNTVSMQAQGITRLSSPCFLSASLRSANLGRAIFGAASAGGAVVLRSAALSAVLFIS